ncbi:MAG TPA: ABC transporter ATP-binding protein [Steroidobacteraceae bacterium]|nr:ABC transporter ATP-binding protein [Steroidobacteraceae bacterium]
MNDTRSTERAKVSKAMPAQATPFAAALLLGKSFGGKRVLSDVTLEVSPGDVIGVLGKNGAGKTTLLELLLGFSPASTGSAQLFGHDSFRLPGAVKSRVGFVPQRDELLDPLTARNQLAVIGSFYSNWDRGLIETLSKQWELDLDQRVKTMSVGQRQKLSILLALGHDPDLLLLDEPVASLDPVARRQFLEQIIDISAGGKRAVVFSSHIVSDVERLANKIWILKEGRLYWQGDLDTLKESFIRIHLHSAASLPQDLALPGARSLRVEANYATALMADWSDETRKQIEAHIDARLEVETLGLEEIFLELHR